MRKLLVVLLALCGPMYGQVVQYGKVMEWSEQGSPLVGVTLTTPSEHDCQPTISDSKGGFRLRFSKHHVGDVIHDITARKTGYEVVNVHVARSWTLTTADTLAIIMAPKAKMKEARSQYYGMSSLMELNGMWFREGDRAIEVESPIYSFHINRYGYDMAASDVDVDIPVTQVVNDKMFAVIVANEYYQQEQQVPYAIHDGEVFREYCIKTLGIPEDHVHWVTDATLNNIRFEVDWLGSMMEAHRGEARGIFYYAGHGIPDEVNRNAYLMPVDGYVGNLESGYGLDDLYAQLGSVNAEAVFYFIDACFSGATRDGNMLAQSRGVTVNSKAGVLRGKTVAFTAAQGNETAYAYSEKSHGLFTYCLLKKLKETQGDVSIGELADYINEQVVRMSVEGCSKSQHPTAAGTMEEWREMKLR